MTSVIETVSAIRVQIKAWRAEGLSIALVPTMGALHEGHMSLIRAALAKADRCVISIFVNPRQFATTEDLDKYPRQLDLDLDKLKKAGVHLAFTPTVNEVYPKGFTTSIYVGGPSACLETDFRPAFFEGVATVVAKLFIQVAPDLAVFGEKDYQQLCVVKKLVKDLDMPLQILESPTIRDSEGLAMSSRNAYLSADELQIARQLNKILRYAASALEGGADEAATMTATRQHVLDAGFDTVDYVSARQSDTLAPWHSDTDGRVLVAARLGKTRLIDNVKVAVR